MKDIFKLAGSTYKVVDGDFAVRGFHMRAIVFIINCAGLGKMKSINGKKITTKTTVPSLALKKGGEVDTTSDEFKVFAKHIKDTYPFAPATAKHAGSTSPMFPMN